MPLNIARLRRWFAAVAIVLVLVVAGFYFYGRIRTRVAVRAVSEKLGVNVQQSTEGFSLSKSEAGRTLFTVHATNAVQYKEGGRAALKNVSIVVYGREGSRFDQISGSDFEYDPQSGDITAQGEVQIDLESNTAGPARPDQAVPPELKNPIHLKTSGLTFNQKTGIAQTRERIEFRIPQANGWAVGTVYDAGQNTITLGSDVHLQTVEGATLLAQHGVITRNPRRAVFTGARVERPDVQLQADEVRLFLRDDNTIERALATGDVRGESRGLAAVAVRAPRAEFFVPQKDQLRSAVLSGGVSFEQGGASPLRGNAGNATLEFGPGNAITRITAGDGLKLLTTQNSSGHPQQAELTAGGARLWLADSQLERGETAGPAQITLRPQTPQPGQTVVSAARFTMQFDRRTGRIRTLHGEPEARIVSSVPGQPDKISTSQALEASFGDTANLERVTQQGNVQYSEGARRASATQARYFLDMEELVLTGPARFVDAGVSTTANTLRLNQKTGDAEADGNVKTTYNDLKAQPGGAMLTSADPLHLTAQKMTAKRATSIARYSGSARLWQDANTVEAPVIVFDRGQRSMLAEGSPGQQVRTVFLESGNGGEAAPVNVTAARLRYTDADRTVRFDGGVLLRGSDATMTAQQATVVLVPAGQAGRARPGNSGAAGPDHASQIERIVAEGSVAIQEPTRRASGERLVYTASDGKYVLTGGLPSIFDAEHGSISGDSLTFFSRDDRVLVGSASSSRTVTQTRVAK